MVSTTFNHAAKFAASTERLAKFRKYAWLLDGQFGIPGTRFRFGLNSIIGLAPVAGDVAMGLISLYLVWEARQMGAPTGLQARMLGNVAIEVVGGSVPILGDLFDMAFKANLRNLALLEEWMKHA